MQKAAGLSPPNGAAATGVFHPEPSGGWLTSISDCSLKPRLPTYATATVKLFVIARWTSKFHSIAPGSRKLGSTLLVEQGTGTKPAGRPGSPGYVHESPVYLPGNGPPIVT